MRPAEGFRRGESEPAAEVAYPRRRITAPVVGISAIVFDIGGVLVDWDPRHLYRKLIPDNRALERFMRKVPLERQTAEDDRGRPWSASLPALCKMYPEYAQELAAWRDRYMEMVSGPIEGSVDILEGLRPAARLFALSNWPAEAAEQLRSSFTFMSWFEAVVVSGEEGIAKPDALLFARLVARYGLCPSTTVFIDDDETNVCSGNEFGFRSIRFQSPSQLRSDLSRLGLLSKSSR